MRQASSQVAFHRISPGYRDVAGAGADFTNGPITLLWTKRTRTKQFERGLRRAGADNGPGAAIHPTQSQGAGAQG